MATRTRVAEEREPFITEYVHLQVVGVQAQLATLIAVTMQTLRSQGGNVAVIGNADPDLPGEERKELVKKALPEGLRRCRPAHHSHHRAYPRQA